VGHGRLWRRISSIGATRIGKQSRKNLYGIRLAMVNEITEARSNDRNARDSDFDRCVLRGGCREESTIDGRIMIRCLHRSVLLKLSSSRGPLGAAETRKYAPVHAGANEGWLERGIIALTKSMLTVCRRYFPMAVYLSYGRQKER
jgi:hypothetical protein